jgi:hypothetical protein
MQIWTMGLVSGSDIINFEQRIIFCGWHILQKYAVQREYIHIIQLIIAGISNLNRYIRNSDWKRKFVIQWLVVKVRFDLIISIF